MKPFSTRTHPLTLAIRVGGCCATELDAAAEQLLAERKKEREELARLEEIEARAAIRLIAATVIAAGVILAVLAGAVQV